MSPRYRNSEPTYTSWDRFAPNASLHLAWELGQWVGKGVESEREAGKELGYCKPSTWVKRIPAHYSLPELVRISEWYSPRVKIMKYKTVSLRSRLLTILHTKWKANNTYNSSNNGTHYINWTCQSNIMKLSEVCMTISSLY